jgi:hypothetical protein
MKLVDINAQPVSEEQAAQVRRTLQAAIDGAAQQMKWCEAFAKFADSFRIESLQGKTLGKRQLGRLIKSLPADVLALGEITVTDKEKSSGWVEFHLTPKAGIVFPLRNDFIVYTEKGFGYNVVERAAKDARERGEALQKTITSNTAMLERLDEEIREYNKAVVLLQEAQQILNNVFIPFNAIWDVSKAMPLTQNLKETR